MIKLAFWFSFCALAFLSRFEPAVPPDQDEIIRHKNLGKAFYENPTTQAQAVDEFKKALDLDPESAPARLNYALALLRAAKTAEGIAELEKVQKQDPTLPHTWFNLGIQFKKEGNNQRALEQFERMTALAPDEPISQYNLGLLYKITGKPDLALKHFEISAKLDSNLAAPRFQLYNAYRSLGREEDANRLLQEFQEIKKRQVGAVIPEDLDWSVYAEIYDVVDPRAVMRPPEPVELRFKSVELSSKSPAASAGLALLKFDSDNAPDLIAWSSDGVKVYRSGSTLIDLPALAGLKDVTSIAPGDFNNDGLSDICVLTASGATLYQNQNSTFEKKADLARGRFSKAIWLDYDHDYDLDLFLLGEKSMLLRNNGAAGFSDQTSAFPFLAGNAVDAVVYDLMKDTNGTDLVVSYQDKPGVLYRDKLGGKFEAVALPSLPAGSRSLAACDINNDGWTDILFAGSGALVLVNQGGKLEKSNAEFSGSGALAAADLENRGYNDVIFGKSVYFNQGIERFSAAKELPDVSGLNAAVAADFDEDGRTDIAAVTTDGAVRLFQNVTETKNRWIRVNLEGVKNLRLAPGAEVEIKSGALYQKKIYQGVPLVFGLQSGAQVETIRITWPNGLIQNEVKPALDKAQTYKEKQRLSGSCPMIYTWNGKEFEFITDVLGVAPLGASSGDGLFFPVDHDEYIQIPGESLRSVGGRCEIRITEELHEVAYIDQVRLIAVDHPKGLEIFTNEKFKAPPFPPFRLFGVGRRIYPKAALNDQGKSVLEELLKKDNVYPTDFRRDYSGTAEMHSLRLDFGTSAARRNKAILVLNGWVDWADGSTFAKVSQERKGGLVMPYLQVRDQSGRWTTVIEDMGIPAGKPKTIVVDLTGKFLSASREIRIVTDVCLYWDEIFLSEDVAAPTAVLANVQDESAQLRFRGFSAPVIHPERTQPERFIYTRWSPVSMWNPTAGLYTRYGDVKELLQRPDDRFVIMGSGDEMRLTFSMQDLPPVREGFVRDYLLKVDGWAKDADLNTAYSQSVEPLPFHGMTSYPYSVSERFPQDRLHREYRERYNQRPALRLLRPLRESGARGAVTALASKP